MGAWGHAAWDNDAAADWFGDVFEGLDLDSKIEAALRYDDHDDDKVRAAAYLLQVLGITYVWPGDLARLDAPSSRAIALLEAMIDPDAQDEDTDSLELRGGSPAAIAAVQAQIAALEARLARE